MEKKKYKKVVLAYSGGLDTSIIIPWLKENYGCEVVAVSGDVGQGTELEGLEEKALKTGASKLYIEDLNKDFIEQYIWPTLKAGAKYEGTYLLGTSFARPIIAKRIVEIAKAEGADAICHGCTGKGNDQVRFELTIKAFAPELDVIAPWRTWDIKSREQEIDYAEAHEIPLKINRETNYSKDKNLWHLSHEGLDLENPQNEPLYDKILELGVSPEKAPDAPTYVTVHFEKGIPTAVDGVEMGAVELVAKLNELGGANGIGIIDIVENRLVGMKSRGVYETPGGTILYHAHEVLETICLDKETMHFKPMVAQKYADLVYNGQWFTPLREALDAFVDDTQKHVTGDVKMKLYKGNIINAGVTSPYTLYDEQTASFGEDDGYNQADSEGFINLFGLPIKEQAKLSKNWDK
ncbi:MAG: argininosuccinate synthase [Clostridia bacterium]|nr:argininosuccinate synthase [Clostridia bacterium]NLS85200.1 argininosuccinate synthase [Oscillospiraceae bacterium]